MRSTSRAGRSRKTDDGRPKSSRKQVKEIKEIGRQRSQPNARPPKDADAEQLGLQNKVSNATVAQELRRYAAALGLAGANKFKLKAYRRAAETVEGLPENLGDLVLRGRDLTDLPGIGTAIDGVIREILRSGNLPRLEQQLAALPAEQAELISHPRLDPKKVARIYKKLKIGSIEELRQQLESGTIREVFGSRLDFHIRQGLHERPRVLLWSIEDVAEQLEAYLRSLPGVERVALAGSLRRKQDTIGDLNYLVSGDSAAEIFDQFAAFGAVQSAERIDDKACRFHLSSGITVLLNWTAPSHWGPVLVQTTGSQAHWHELQARAKQQHLILTAETLGKRRNLTEEKQVYAALGLDYIEPELREGRGEIEAAAEGRLPNLITRGDIRGDLHMHTTASDGSESIEGMAAAAQKLGYEYIAITDHSQSLRLTNGLSEKRLAEQIEAIDRINEQLSGFRILKSSEVDILEDGSLDYSPAMLRQLDLTICSIHSRFALDKAHQTARLLRAMDNPYFNILGHATGRLLLSREGYEFDVDRVIGHAQENGCFFEINSSPNRLDLSEEHAKLAKDAGVLIAVNTDAHSIRELEFISAGINQARRGWLEAKDVLNTRPVKQLLQLLRR